VKPLILKFLICLTLYGCEIPQQIKDTEPDELEEENKTELEFSDRSIKQSVVRDVHPAIQAYPSQDRTKSFEDLRSHVVKGTAKLPFPPETLLD
jgi:hypothetical protein